MNQRKTFFQFVIPSVMAFALSGVYTIVDGFFIGNSLGDPGLASITLGCPISAFIQAVGTGVGLSGAIRFTILRGQREEENAASCMSSTILLLTVVSFLLTCLVLLFLAPLLRLLGAEGDLLPLTAEYVKIIALGAVFQIFATGLVPFIRNLDGAAFAMIAMIAGFLTNILLDYLFVWVLPWGMGGAAWATIIGQGVTMLAAILYLRKKKVGFSVPPLQTILSFFRAILKISVAPFGLTFSPQITAILMNRFFMFYGGEQSVAAYGCIAYITAIVYLLLQGVGDGSQPLISRYFSENRLYDMKETRRLAYLLSAGIALLSMAGLGIARNHVGILFGASAATNVDVSNYLLLFLIPLLALSYTRITTAFLYGTEKAVMSYLLVYAEPLFTFVSLLVLPRVFESGLQGVWIAVPLAQAITWCVALKIKRRADRQMLLP